MRYLLEHYTKAGLVLFALGVVLAAYCLVRIYELTPTVMWEGDDRA